MATAEEATQMDEDNDADEALSRMAEESASEVLIATPDRNYTTNDYQQLFAATGCRDGLKMLNNVNKVALGLDAPRVAMHNLYGVNVSTEHSYVYKQRSSFADEQPTIVYGDGIVSLRSMTGFKQWIGKQAQPIVYRELPGVQHNAMLWNGQVIDYILNLAVESVDSVVA